jgi:hypothetical protein
MWNAIALMTKCMLTVRTRDLSVRNSRLENENVVAFGAFAAIVHLHLLHIETKYLFIYFGTTVWREYLVKLS